MEIILFIEETFDIKVNDNEMLPVNLDSVDNLAAFVQRKQAQAVAA
jgi:acyl carrier protein